MDVLMAAMVVTAAVLSACVCPARCQADRADDKYLDPNDFFLAGGDQQERRRVQDAFNRRVLLRAVTMTAIDDNCFDQIDML